MSSLRLTLCTGVLAAVTTLTPAAYAAEGEVSVRPSAPAPGSDIALRVTGCTGRTAVAASAAFVADARLTGTDGTLTGETRIRTALDVGVYDVKVTCDGDEREAALTVGSGKGAAAAAPTGHASSGHPPTGHASPVAPVRAGGGGTADLATVERSAGPGTAHTITGLVLAGVAAVAVALRSARRSRGTD
ncbi:hypothetical protein [Streptomyces sp. NPDC057877]|uniref:hypothetical protein n=1 Tax=Streptomyces sp. NPDC057877 TaxID=3346269 RepID=UPI003689AFE5